MGIHGSVISLLFDSVGNDHVESAAFMEKTQIALRVIATIGRLMFKVKPYNMHLIV